MLIRLNVIPSPHPPPPHHPQHPQHTGRKRSGSPRDRLEYRAERLGLAERSLSHGREASLAGHGSSSSRSRDPRVDERVRRVSPEQLTRDRYRCVCLCLFVRYNVLW